MVKYKLDIILSEMSHHKIKKYLYQIFNYPFQKPM